MTKKKKRILGIIMFFIFSGIMGMTAVRERWLPLFYLDLNYYSSEFRVIEQIKDHSDANVPKFVKKGSLDISYCQVDCKPQGVLCNSFKSMFPCVPKSSKELDFDFDLDDANKDSKKQQVDIAVEFSFQKIPFCYIPFYKSSHVPFETKISFSRIFDQELPVITIFGELNFQTTGIIACYDYQKQLGKQAAQFIVKKVKQVFGESP